MSGNMAAVRAKHNYFRFLHNAIHQISNVSTRLETIRFKKVVLGIALIAQAVAGERYYRFRQYGKIVLEQEEGSIQHA
jgi:hypothetical protein